MADTVKMKPLRSFRVSETGKMAKAGGPEIEVSEATANDYERRGMAVRVAGKLNIERDAPKKNEAAEAGATGGPRGGATGAQKVAPSSRQGQARKKSRSKK